ncbi:MAG: rhodanese-like domain-containing protein [bacterium]|nr:rhodanese-like domain-containing protein [bacterium]
MIKKVKYSLHFLMAHQTNLLFLAGGIAISFLLFYLTPLKNVNIVEPRIRDIRAEEFHQDFSANPEKYIFIDVRPPSNYEAAHANGSINVPLAKMYFQRHELPKRGKTIVLICSKGIASGVAYGYLEHYGFQNLRRIDGGIEAWQDAGLPTVIGPNQWQ